MKLSIVVPAFNEEKLLGETLGCIRAAAGALDCDIELIVCDNNSTDGTAEIARNAGAAVVFEPINQIARARNAILGGGCTVQMESDDRFARLAVWMWNRVSRAMHWAAGSFIFCRATAFRELGGFNEALYAAEEIDFSRRLKRLGKMTILHRHPLLTSGRKARLYSWRELLSILFRAIVTGGKALRRREECFAWYDGRR